MEDSTKRRIEGSDGGGSEGPRRKRARDVREVAELTMALAAMVEMRGGGGPTAAERGMMAEARGRLAEVCAGFSPREVFPVDAFGAVMEDLGLDKVRERTGLGSRPNAKLSIAEKLMYTKLKFEKSEANSLRAAKQSAHGVEAEIRGTADIAKMFPLDKAKPATVSSAVFHPVSPTVHASAVNSSSLPYQLPASEVRKHMVSSGLPNSLPGKDLSQSLSRVGRPPLGLDQRSNGYTQIQANVPGDHAQSVWSQHTQSASFAKPGSQNKVLPQNLVKLQSAAKVEGSTLMTTSRMASQAAAPKPFITQTASGLQPTMNQQMRRTNVVETSLPKNTHSEISGIVQKFLLHHVPKRPAWNPPSRDYMNKSVTCQECKLAIVEVENVLVCDACENGYHIKCLHTQDLKEIPRGEWHCFQCLALTDGKPLPPKYGRVTRNMTAPKPARLSSPDKKAGISSDKAKQQKLMSNGSTGLQSSSASSMNVSSPASNISAPSTRAMQRADISIRHHKDDKTHPGSGQNEHVIVKVATAPSSASVEIFHKEKLGSELKGDTPPKPPETVTKVLDHMQSCINDQGNDLKVIPCSDGIPSKQCYDNHLGAKKLENFDSSKSHDGNLSVDIKQEEKGVACLEFVENSEDHVSYHATSSSDGSNFVDWIGDVVQLTDEKTYYSSCCINGSVYKVQDHALFLCNNKQMPSKIQTMWEDNKTRLKWVIVNRCYFPGDLPKAVGHPCSLEGDEVYESNHGCTMLASLIQGPCEVLQPEKFLQECKRRSRLGSEEKGGLPPIFQCKWFYDELKGSFRDLSS